MPQLDLALILQTIAVLTLGALALVAIQWLRTWRTSATIGQQQSALDQLAGYARVFVRAAEQQFQTNPAKLAYVLDQLNAIFPDVDADLIRGVVEAVVHELKSGPQPDRPPQPVSCDDLAAPATRTASTPPAKVARSHTAGATPTARP